MKKTTIKYSHQFFKKLPTQPESQQIHGLKGMLSKRDQSSTLHPSNSQISPKPSQSSSKAQKSPNPIQSPKSEFSENSSSESENGDKNRMVCKNSPLRRRKEDREKKMKIEDSSLGSENKKSRVVYTVVSNKEADDTNNNTMNKSGSNTPCSPNTNIPNNTNIHIDASLTNTNTNNNLNNHNTNDNDNSNSNSSDSCSANSSSISSSLSSDSASVSNHNQQLIQTHHNPQFIYNHNFTNTIKGMYLCIQHSISPLFYRKEGKHIQFSL